MHLRRNFVDAIQIIESNTTGDLDDNCPEARIIHKIAEIYHLNTPLNQETPEKRLAVREEKISRLVDKLFEDIHGLVKDPDVFNTFSETMQNALNYAINHEEKFKVFLHDPAVPIDNGAAERAIKPINLIRRNSLFSTSLGGVSYTCTLLSLIETAKANGHSAQLYLDYLSDEAGAFTQAELKEIEEDPDQDFEFLMPWSQKFQEFLKSRIENQQEVLEIIKNLKYPDHLLSTAAENQFEGNLPVLDQIDQNQNNYLPLLSAAMPQSEISPC